MSQGKGLGNKLKKSDVAKRKQSTDRRQAALEAWELRYFFKTERVVPEESSRTKETRTDVYIVATEDVGLKLKDDGEGIELKVRLVLKKRGAEKWIKSQLEGDFSLTSNFTKLDLVMAIKEKNLLNDSDLGPKIQVALDKIDKIGIHFVTIKREIFKKYDYVVGITCEYSKMTVSSPSVQNELVCYTNCLENSAITKPKVLYNKSLENFNIPKADIGVKIFGSGFPQFVSQYLSNTLVLND